MKLGIIGGGGVGSACLLSLVMRGIACQVVVLDKNHERAKSVVADLQYGATLSPAVERLAGDYAELAGAVLVIITAGINEKAGGATDRSDPVGRLRLLDTNADVYREIVAKIVAVAPQALILVVTDPPDPLADIARALAGHERILSSGSFLDTLRFRFHLARRLKVNPMYVEAQVVGEHVLGRQGVTQILEPEMSEDERQAFQRSADILRDSVARITQPSEQRPARHAG